MILNRLPSHFRQGTVVNPLRNKVKVCALYGFLRFPVWPLLSTVPWRVTPFKAVEAKKVFQTN